MVVPTSKAQHPARPLDSLVRACPHWCLSTSGWKVSEVTPCPLTSTWGASSCPAPGQVMEGLASRPRPLGRHVGSRERKQPWPAGLPRSLLGRPLALIPQSSEATRAPSCRSCAQCDLSFSGQGSEDALSPVLPSPWLLKGQAPVAWILLELDLLQGEDGGSVFELVHTLPQGPEVGVPQGRLC